MNNKNKISIGVGIAATAAGIAGAYYFYASDKGPKHRKQIKSWVENMEAEVMDKLNDVKEVNSEIYKEIVSTVAEKYKQLKDIEPKEVVELVSRMHDHWKEIKKDIGKTAKKATK